MKNYPDNIDAKSEVFIRAVYDLGGEATTTEIYEETGIPKNSRDYRFQKLEDMGLITVGKADTGYGRRKAPKVATLTDEGISEVESHPVSDDAHDMYFDHKRDEVLDDLVDRVERLENIVDVLKVRVKTIENWREKLSDTFSV
ncbi:ArsR family transcriptional regulator [Haloterrigena sp. H1]|uniref:helix-turn-helix domain-containing protein n=1 Tax=Haloterrigena sp. H1 TaxID=2552943 RepID=UPI00110E7BAA|nr:helix-turn-helix domain-containing protein [Haloterrigena sp. H1]TMT85811.1 ArsR family transcriptional regulator [Haloterrigena sp. H1]